MNALIRVCLGTLVALLSWPVHAESLRCNGSIAAEGDSRLSVLFKCGPPLLADSYCAPVYVYGAWQPVPEPFASSLVPCQPVEEWLYDRGDGNLMATVRFRSGVVQSIRYARVPR
ncbi:MAG TPA: DUF2845 domain-containing protein [Albitalea sp.]|nr:DUF2845 domain-containing protein [Albitalea sp.]